MTASRSVELPDCSTDFLSETIYRLSARQALPPGWRREAKEQFRHLVSGTAGADKQFDGDWKLPACCARSFVGAAHGNIGRPPILLIVSGPT